MKIRTVRSPQAGFTLAELVIGMVVLSIIALSILGLFTALVNSALVAKRKAVASTLATNQMEYLKSLPYDSLAVAGGSIISSSPLPATITKTLDNVTYTIKTSINYVDDAYDGCASYPTQALKQLYCRNYPPPSGSPAVDSNPADYKIAHVSVYDKNNTGLAEVDTQISARVSETASTTGALFVSVLDDHGNPVQGATVEVTDTTINPHVDVSDSTDSSGNAVFYGLPPDSNNYDYVVTASNLDYSTLTTIPPSGTLQPTYTSQKIFTQQSSFVTLTIMPQGQHSIVLEAVDTAGNPIANVKTYVKGGYKKYTLPTNTAYYFDNMTPSDTRPTADASGLSSIDNLVPGTYILCGDNAGTNCKVGNTRYYLAAAIPYGGTSPFNPIIVPSYLASSPPATTFPYNGNNYLQKVRLILTTNSSFPRITNLSPSEASVSAGVSNFAFQINGTNLPCSSSPGSCGTSVTVVQGASSFPASCTGTSGTQINCTANLSSASIGSTHLVITANGNTLTTPDSPLLGGINVVP